MPKGESQGSPFFCGFAFGCASSVSGYNGPLIMLIMMGKMRGHSRTKMTIRAIRKKIILFLRFFSKKLDVFGEAWYSTGINILYFKEIGMNLACYFVKKSSPPP
jgi:hypothetical protein